MKRLSLSVVLGATALALTAYAFITPVQASASDGKLRQLIQPRTAPLAKPPEAAAGAHRELSVTRAQERQHLLNKGEAALARLDVEAALQNLERAALILHAADTEIALVRAYMQGGQYRRALAFGAHTAGAHLDVTGAAALYAWLLHLGGQTAIAQRLLAEAESRQPGQALTASVQRQLRSDTPVVSRQTPELIGLPTRLAPYGRSDNTRLPASAGVLGNAVLLPDGKFALAPAGSVPRSGLAWVRNGLGHVSRARLRLQLDGGLALMQLDRRLGAPDDMVVHTGNSFPGSVAYAVEYSASADAMPAWPILRTGFIGNVLAEDQQQKLGISMPPGPRGGPVFDALGRLSGIALTGQGPQAANAFLPLSQVIALLEKTTNPAAMQARKTLTNPAARPASPAKPAIDLIYENSLKSTLQLIGVP